MSGGGGSGKKQTVTNSNEPYSGAKPMIDQSLKQAQQLFQSGALSQTPFPGQTVAGDAPETVQGWESIAGRANAGSPLLGASEDYLTSVLQPGFLSQTPDSLNGVLDIARNQANAATSMAGRGGSNAHGVNVASALAPVLYQDYARRAGLQAQAAGMAPGIDQAGYFGGQQLLNVGGQRKASLQDQINANIERHNALQNAPGNELANYQSLLGIGQGYGTSSQTQPRPPGTNPWLAGIGTAAGIGSLFL